MNRLRISRLAAAAFGALALSGTASASPTCTASFYSQYESCQSNSLFCSPYSSPEEFVAAHPGCFPGGTTTSQAKISATAFTQIFTNTQALVSRLMGQAGALVTGAAPVQGLAAGGKSPWNVWGSVSANDTRQGYSIGVNNIKNELDSTTAVLGLDYTVSPQLIVGASVSFDRTLGRMQPTALAAWDESTTKGVSIAPYLGYQISKELVLDATLGIGEGWTSNSSSVESDASRFFFGGNLSYATWIRDWQLTGRAGYMHGEENVGALRAAGTPAAGTAGVAKLDRWQIGAQAAYWFGGVQPYAGLTYVSDSRSSTLGGADPVGKNALQWALGVNFFSLAKGLNGGLSYMRETGRNNQTQGIFSANVGFRY